MLPFQNLISTDKESAFPVFRQITDKLIDLVQQGFLKPGIYLPGTRQMADILHVNRKTIIKVYEEMLLENWVEAVSRKGYRVTLDLPITKPRSFQPKTSYFLAKRETETLGRGKPQNFIGEQRLKYSDILVDDGYPDSKLSPYKEMNRIYSDPTSITAMKHLLPAKPEGGLKVLKAALSSMLNDSRGLNISENELIITRGGQMPLYIAIKLLIKPGDIAAVAEINEPGINEILEHSGASLLKLKMDQQGIDIAELEEILKTKKIKVLYLAPHNQYPTTIVMSPERRMGLIRLMNLYGFWVIENDMGYDFDFSNRPILPMASADHGGRLIYIGCFDRIISSSIRLGYLIACPEIIQMAAHFQGLIDQHGDVQMESMLGRMISSGDYNRHIIKAKKVYSERCELLCKLLETTFGNVVRFSKPTGGMAVWLIFRPGFPLEQFIAESAVKGLFLQGTRFSSVPGAFANCLRFGFASLNQKEIQRAVEIMTEVSKRLYFCSSTYHNNLKADAALTA